ncbi:MAG: AtpZ/AtpI family protein [Bryocella sp.]
MADETQDEQKKPSSAVRSFGQVEQMVQLAIALPAACLIGWLAGAWLDKHFGTTWCGLAGIGVGAVAGFVQLYTTASRILNKGK